MENLADVLNREYLSIRVWEEDGVFIAKCLDIPGCVTEGDSREEALANIEDAIRACLDVILDDSQNPPDQKDSVEIIERPIGQFIHA